MDQEIYITPTAYSRYKLIDKILRKMPINELKCCEIGCGTGIFLKRLETLGVKCSGFDSSLESIKIAKGRLNPSLFQIERKDLFEIKEKFDMVFLFEVLEHIENHEDAINHIGSNILNNNGLLLLSVPGAKWMFSEMDRYYGHHRHYTRNELKTLLMKHGLTPIIFWNYGLVATSLGAILLYKLFYNKPDINNFTQLTERSGRLNYPQFWKIIHPVLSKTYYLFYIIDFLFMKFNLGIEHLVLCKK